MRTRSLPVVLALVICACGSSPPPPEVAADLVEGPSRTTQVDVATLVDEASDARLASVLEDAGFQAGTERMWVDRQGDIWRTVVRGLRFDSAEGADAYIAWVGVNVASLIGPTTRTMDSPLAFEHAPSDCCPNKDGPQALAATADGEVAWVVMLAGPAADAARAVALLPGGIER